MGNKFPIISLLLFVVCFLAAIFVSHDKIPQAREKMYQDVQPQLSRVYFPAMGFDKFYADTQWIQLIQEMANQEIKKGPKDGKKKEITDEDIKAEKEERAKRAKYFYKQFDFLTDLDPNNEMYYEHGALYLQNDLPDSAIKLLKKGNKLLKTPSWKYPFQQYFIIHDIKGQRDEKKLAEYTDEMSALLKQAMDRSNAPAHVQKKWLRLEAKKNGLTDDDLGRLQLWANYYKQKTHANMVSGEETTIQDAYYQDGADSELLKQIITMAQDMALDNWKKQQKAQGDEKKKLEEEHKKISEVFFSIAPKGHYSPVSLRPYAAGDQFDVYTGTPVKPYGANPELLKQGIVVIYKGPYCQITGKPRADSGE